jgi:hypothetical protein
MGYSVEYIGKIAIDPPLNSEELAYLRQLVKMRHIPYQQGPYSIRDPHSHPGDQSGNYYTSDPTKPSTHCDWVLTDDGTAIEWGSGSDRFYPKYAIPWMRYLIDHFLKPDPIARQVQPADFGFLTGHRCNGTIKIRIDEFNQNMELIVVDNIVVQRDLPKTAEQLFSFTCPHCGTTIPVTIVIGQADLG